MTDPTPRHPAFATWIFTFSLATTSPPVNFTASSWPPLSTEKSLCTATVGDPDSDPSNPMKNVAAVAASRTVIATIRMTPMTGETALDESLPVMLVFPTRA